MNNSKQTMPRTLTGKVASNKMKDTIIVVVERLEKHPKYPKFVRRSTKVYAHDKGNTSQMGDTVVIKECPPLSKNKSWALIEIKERAEQIAVNDGVNP